MFMFEKVVLMRQNGVSGDRHLTDIFSTALKLNIDIHYLPIAL